MRRAVSLSEQVYIYTYEYECICIRKRSEPRRTPTRAFGEGNAQKIIKKIKVYV